MATHEAPDDQAYARRCRDWVGGRFRSRWVTASTDSLRLDQVTHYRRVLALPVDAVPNEAEQAHAGEGE